MERRDDDLERRLRAFAMPEPRAELRRETLARAAAVVAARRRAGGSRRVGLLAAALALMALLGIARALPGRLGPTLEAPLGVDRDRVLAHELGVGEAPWLVGTIDISSAAMGPEWGSRLEGVP